MPHILLWNLYDDQLICDFSISQDVGKVDHELSEHDKLLGNLNISYILLLLADIKQIKRHSRKSKE